MNHVEQSRFVTSGLARPAAIATALPLAGFAGSIHAQDSFPSETIQVVTHSGVGGGTDVNARMITQQVQETAGINMEIVNRIGGAGMLALSYVNSRPADGHTVAFVTPPISTASARAGRPSSSTNSSRSCARPTTRT